MVVEEPDEVVSRGGLILPREKLPCEHVKWRRVVPEKVDVEDGCRLREIVPVGVDW